MRASLAAAQLELLHRLAWRTRLDLQTELAPCRHLLFHAPPAPLLATTADGALTAQTASQVVLHERRRWAATMHSLQAEVLGQAATARWLATRAAAACAAKRRVGCQEAPSKRARRVVPS